MWQEGCLSKPRDLENGSITYGEQNEKSQKRRKNEVSLMGGCLAMLQLGSSKCLTWMPNVSCLLCDVGIMSGFMDNNNPIIHSFFALVDFWRRHYGHVNARMGYVYVM